MSVQIHETQGPRRGDRWMARSAATAARTRYGRQARIVGMSSIADGVREVTVGTPVGAAWSVDAVWVVTEEVQG